MWKIRAMAILFATAMAATAFGGDSMSLYYPLNSANPTGSGVGGGWTIVPFAGAASPEYRNDDDSTGVIPLPIGFEYCFFGTMHTSLSINNNGNITFGAPYSAYTPAGFPIATPMLAPFWADVDTRNAAVGGRPTNLVYYQYFDNGTTTPTDDVFVVTWDQVGYYDQQNDKRNTFQVAMATDPNQFGPGLNTVFSYGLMEWTTGDASGGIGGFGGSPATVGINEGAGAMHHDEWGRYDTAQGVATLSGQKVFFNGCEGTFPRGGCTTPPQNMVLWMPFDEASGGAGSITDNVLHPTADGTLGFSTDLGGLGEVGNAVCIDEGRVDVPSYPALFLDQDMTMDAWITGAGGPGFTATIVDKRQFVGLTLWQGYWFYVDASGVLTLELNDGVGPAMTAVGPNVFGLMFPGQWLHIAVTAQRDCSGLGSVCVNFWTNGVHFVPASPLVFFGETGTIGTSAGLCVGDELAAPGADGFHGCIDELEIFDRALSDDEIRRIYNAQEAGKCKAHCDADWTDYFFANQTSIITPLLVCNDSSSPQCYSLSFFAANCPGSSSPGPSGITASPAWPICVPPGTCSTVWLNIPRPPFVNPGDESCYTVCMTNTATGELHCCNGSVHWAREIIFLTDWPPLKPGDAFIDVDFDLGPVSISSGGTDPLAIAMRVRVMGPDMEPDTAAVSLNGLPPGEPVVWFAKAPPGSIDEIPLVARFLVNDPGQPYWVVLEADLDGDGDYEAIESFTLVNRLSAGPCNPAVDENFEFHPPGTVCGIEGFVPWQNETDVCGEVSTEQASSGNRSLKIVGNIGGSGGLGDDTVLPVSGVESGVWTFRCMTYVPVGAAGDAAVILLNTYDDVSPPQSAWYSAQVRFRSASNRVQADIGAGIATLIKGQWVELRIEIDLANNLANYFYNGVQFVTNRPWTDGVVPGSPGAPRLRAIDFYGGEPASGGTSGMYFDDVSIKPACTPGGGVDCNQNGVDDALDIAGGTSRDCYSADKGLGGHPDGIPDECQCIADWNHDGIPNSTDVSDFINTYFADQASGGASGDINCDGVDNSTDVSEFINLWFAAQSGQLPYAGCSI